MGSTSCGGENQEENNTNNSSSNNNSQNNNSQGCTSNNNKGPAAGEIDVDLLPLVYDVIKTVERESAESTQQRRSEFTETAGKVIEFQKKLDLIRDQIRKLPGIDHSKEDQLRRLDSLRKQLVLKKKLLQKYKEMCTLEEVKQYLTPMNSSSSSN